MPRAQNMSLDSTLLGNRCIVHRLLTTLPVGTHILQSGITYRIGLINHACIFACMKAIEIFEFLYDSESLGYVMDNNKL